MAVDSAALASSDGADCDTKRIQPATAAKSAPPTAAAMSKPKWAMTEDEADNVEEAEAADLVNFASSLNYDSFIDDLEVRPTSLFQYLLHSVRSPPLPFPASATQRCSL